VAHFKLSHSRAFFLRAYLLQTHEMLFDAHYQVRTQSTSNDFKHSIQANLTEQASTVQPGPLPNVITTVIRATAMVGLIRVVA
jgi:hypothetical protein